MKNYILFFALLLSTTLLAQDLASKVPANSPFAVCINSKNLNDKVALKTIQDYPWMRELLEKELQFLPKDLSQTGIDLTKSSYQYYISRDTVMNYVVLIPLNNVGQFEKLIQTKYGDSLTVKKQSNYSTITTSRSNHLAWNDTFAVMVHATYIVPEKPLYSEPYSDLDTIENTGMWTDTVVAKPVYDYDAEPEVVKPKKTAKKEKTTKSKKGKKGKKTVKEPTEEEIYAAQEKAYAELEETERILREIESKKSDSIANVKIAPIVAQIFKETFENNKKNKIEKSTIFKNNDPKSDFYAFADLDLLTSQLFSSFSGANKALLGIYKNGVLNSNYHINGYFEKDKIRFSQFVTPKSEELKKSFADMLSSKMDKNLLNYVGNNNLAHYSISMNTEAVMNYEYMILKSTLNTIYSSYSKDAKANEADVIIDAIALLLDEKAIADLLPGNAIFVLHDLKKVQRDYISYDYDDNYEQIETTSTKEEIQPDFTFIMNTRNESFINKLLKLPLDKSKIIGTDYQLTNGYYSLHFEKDNLLEDLYFGLKNGVFMITTSNEHIENLMDQKAMPLQSDFRKAISKNNSSGWFDVQKIIAASKTENQTETNSNNWDIALRNAGELNLESKFKNGEIVSEITYKINGDHTNSLQYFFDVINELYAEKQKEIIVSE